MGTQGNEFGDRRQGDRRGSDRRISPDRRVSGRRKSDPSPEFYGTIADLRRNVYELHHKIDEVEAAERPKLFKYMFNSVKKLKRPLKVAGIVTLTVLTYSAFRNVNDLIKENNRLSLSLNEYEKKYGEMKGLEEKVIMLEQDQGEFDEKIIEPEVKPSEIKRKGKKSRTSKKTGRSVLLGKKTLRKVAWDAISDGVYTKIAILDIITELYKKYYDDDRLPKGDTIKIHRDYLEPVLKRSAFKKTYEERDIEPIVDMRKLEYIALYTKKVKGKKRRGYSVKCTSPLTQKIPRVPGTVAFSEHVSGYITHNDLEKSNEKITVYITDGTVQFIPSFFVKPFYVTKSILDREKNDYIGELHGWRKNGKKSERVGWKLNLSKCSPTGMRPISYNKKR